LSRLGQIKLPCLAVIIRPGALVVHGARARRFSVTEVSEQAIPRKGPDVGVGSDSVRVRPNGRCELPGDEVRVERIIGGCHIEEVTSLPRTWAGSPQQIALCASLRVALVWALMQTPAIAKPPASLERGDPNCDYVSESTATFRANAEAALPAVALPGTTGKSDVPASLRGLRSCQRVPAETSGVNAAESIVSNDRVRSRGAPGQSPRPAAQSPRSEPAFTLRGFGQVGILGFAARQSFAAVTGASYGTVWGAGVKLRFQKGMYLQGSLERYEKTGERVFVFNGQIFSLGIPDTVTVIPAVVAAGYQPLSEGAVKPYAGAGIGSYLVKEASPFDADDEIVDRRFVGYHVHAGVELRTYRWFTPAIEGRYTTIPEALGSSGVTGEFAERNLGGWQLHAKILIGH
jgi:opacity protein-like surface antigen